MEWIITARDAPYFQTESGENWTPIGHNDALSWPTLSGCFMRKDMPSVERYLAMLAANGITVLRVMLEYNHREHRYLERPAGKFNSRMVRFWDDLLGCCLKHGVRVLLTPFDTFWMWKRWKHHPYNSGNGGPLPTIQRMLLDTASRQAIKSRLRFATERWGSTGVIFAWDLWNEIHPAMAEGRSEPLQDFITDVGSTLRTLEERIHGRAHLQTVSIFGPIGLQHPIANRTVLTHPGLNFATTHFYEKGTIDNPRNTVDAAISTGQIMRDTLAQTSPSRPFFDSESGPIHAFKDRHRILPELFDDEYFRHMQWAHFASGGAGGGMRWPNRHPHILTAGMHRAQSGLSAFLPLIDWGRFCRRNWNNEVRLVTAARLATFACGDESQALIWLLRRDALDAAKRVKREPEVYADITLPQMKAGTYKVTLWDTNSAAVRERRTLLVQPGALPQLAQIPIPGDIAIAVSATVSPRSP
jgi:hypothetical protein